MLFGKLRIFGKLTLLVLVPLLGVVALALPIIVNRIDIARQAQDTADVAQLATQVGSAVQELSEERLLSVGYLFGLVERPDLVVQSAEATDRVLGLRSLDRPLTPRLREAVENVRKLDSTRAAVLNLTIRPDLAVAEFTAVITPIIDGLGLQGAADLTTSTGRQVFALDQALRSNDLISQASSQLTSAVATQNAGLINLFSSTLLQLQFIIGGSQTYFTPDQYKLYTGAQQAFAARVGDQFFTRAATDPVSAVKLLKPDTLYPSLTSVVVLGGFVEKRIAADVDVAVADNRQTALRTAGLVGGAAVFLLILVVALSLLMARAVALPLRRLTYSADRIARAGEAELERVADDDVETARPIRLDDVDVAAQDEIGDLARAFDRVQTTAARLVERQVLGRRNVAQMFGHVGRRTQNLVGRQLALIDNLERRETDSDRLRELYRLDHMSSRLGRNASSLVVLSGAVGANDHMAPLPLSDVVRLALGEIEDYTRVDVEVPEEIVVVPAVLADLTLLLAELMENATSFSPPHTRVTVTAAELRGGARLAVIDHGLGLTPERIAEENARLTRRERLDLAPSEVLGLFVVGRLARRHGIEVTLTDTPDGGTTAWVDLGPEQLVARREAIAPVQPIQATVPSQHTEFIPLIAGTAVRSVPGSAQPFDANALHRVTKTLEVGRSWNAFAPVRAGTPALEAAPSGYAERVEHRPSFEAPAGYDGTPVAGRFPAAIPELPSAGRYVEPEPPLVVEGPIVSSAPADAIQLPHQRTEPGQYHPRPEPPRFEQPEPPLPAAVPAPPAPPRTSASAAPLRRRVPGNQMPAETGPKLPDAPPTSDDALAAREAFDAFEAGVSRAQWDVIEQNMSSPPAAGHPPLSRRVPGASLPVGEPPQNPVPASPAQPLDPDAVRAQMEQFEYGVARALNETQPQPEGQPR